MAIVTTARLKAIRPKHVRLAIEELKRSGVPPAHQSKTYHLMYEGVAYPQRYVASVATRYASGIQLFPGHFSASESLPVLKSLGYTIEAKEKVKSSHSKVDGAISGEVIGDLYYFSKEIYEERAAARDALLALHLNHGSARDCFRNFRQMLNGKLYQRTMDAAVTDYFLEHIHQDYGADGLRQALQAVDQHLDYYDTLGSGSQRQIRALWRKYKAMADAGQHGIKGSYAGPSPSFRPKATNTVIDLTRANKMPNAALSRRDKSFLSDIWSRYGMADFERKNIDAGNIRRVLERGYLRYTSGDPATSTCKFQLTVKARMLCESADSLFLNEVGSQTAHSEGDASEVMRKIFKRNPNARADCLKHHGYRCKACGFDFQKTYGHIGREYIHVHHLTEISSIGEKYIIDPINDLVPVCPNCHAMLHQKRPAMKIEELAQIVKGTMRH
jgi:5-methylcytosine-specific restriction protein A